MTLDELMHKSSVALGWTIAHDSEIAAAASLEDVAGYAAYEGMYQGILIAREMPEGAMAALAAWLDENPDQSYENIVKFMKMALYATVPPMTVAQTRRAYVERLADYPKRGRPVVDPWMQTVDALLDERWGAFMAETSGIRTRRATFFGRVRDE